MIDALPSDPRRDGSAATQSHRRLIVGAVAALAIVGGMFVWRVAGGAATDPTTSAAAPAKSPVLSELVETTKALEISQQQAIDQLQAMQELLATQQAETKKSADEVAALSEKLESLRQSFASMPTTATQVEADDPPEKPRRTHRRSRAHRGSSSAHAAATTP